MLAEFRALRVGHRITTPPNELLKTNNESHYLSPRFRFVSNLQHLTSSDSSATFFSSASFLSTLAATTLLASALNASPLSHRRQSPTPSATAIPIGIASAPVAHGRSLTRTTYAEVVLNPAVVTVKTPAAKLPPLTACRTCPEYQQLGARMKERCHNPNNPKYNDYGGRGITVCDEWRYDFPAFLELRRSQAVTRTFHRPYR